MAHINASNTGQINVCWATGPNPLGELKLSADVINKTFSSLSSAAGSSATALPFALDDLPVSSASSTSTSTSTLSSASTSTSGSTSTSTSTASTASTSSTSTSTSTDSSNSSASSASSAASSSASSSTNLSGGAIAGIVIGVLAGIILAALGAFFLWKRNKGQQHQPYQLDAPLYGHGQDVKYADSLKQAHEVFVPPAEMYTPTAELSTPTAEMYSPPVEMEARDGLTRRVDGNGL
ncbi:hypothetical protein AJ79_06418 [Helicocarpus griseus UAMH5409]|uniref:Mid2 domain-containing protein n=1 Tax=Helicocarpus griseus UAMH5409 TaxID=1447875 RepID=A0A2B7X5L0_9EURO|nr:hypothetical protein AJ79_06418 [Helicocarpus griseus UAMH5409]